MRHWKTHPSDSSPLSICLDNIMGMEMAWNVKIKSGTHFVLLQNNGMGCTSSDKCMLELMEVTKWRDSSQKSWHEFDSRFYMRAESLKYTLLQDKTLTSSNFSAWMTGKLYSIKIQMNLYNFQVCKFVDIKILGLLRSLHNILEVHPSSIKIRVNLLTFIREI